MIGSRTSPHGQAILLGYRWRNVSASTAMDFSTSSRFCMKTASSASPRTAATKRRCIASPSGRSWIPSRPVQPLNHPLMRLDVYFLLSLAQPCGELRIGSRRKHDLHHRDGGGTADHLPHGRRKRAQPLNRGHSSDRAVVVFAVLLIDGAQHRNHQVRLGGELMCHGAAAQSCFLGDGRYRGLAVPRAMDACDGRLDQLRSCLGSPLGLGPALSLW